MAFVSKSAIMPLLRLPVLFWIPAIVVFLLFLVGLFLPEWFLAVVNRVNEFIYSVFGQFYLWFALITLIVFLLIGVSPLGRIRLGGIEAKPEFSLFSWFAMLFCAGMGTGLMFWGATEPLYHYMNPPLMEAVTPNQRAELAFHYTFFHWGLHPWAIYGMTALAISFFGFNLNKGFTFSAFLGLSKTDTPLKRLLCLGIDLLTIFAIIFGISATYGMGTLQLQGGLTSLFGVSASPWVLTAIVFTMAGIYLASALSNIRSGIRLLGDIGFWLYLVLLASVLWLAPKSTLWQSVVEGLPAFFSRLPAMSLGWGNYHDPRWVGDWTVKYWSWWIAWAPFVGIFIAFISKGRTVRQLVFGTVVLPTLFSCLWFTILGQTGIALQESRHFVGSTLDLQQVNLVLFNLVHTLSQNSWLGLLCLSIIAIDFINSANGATYTIACLSERDMDRTPSLTARVVWGFLFALLTLLFLWTGGIHLLQQVTLITALPFTFLLVPVFLWLIPAMINDIRKPALDVTDQYPVKLVEDAY